MEPLSTEDVHFLVRTELDAINAAYGRLRSTCTDLAGNAFRIDVAARLEDQQRINRGLSYRMFGEIAEPADRPVGVKVRDVLAVRLRLTAGEVKRRFAIASRIRTRRSLTGQALPPELPALAAAIEAGDVGEDHIKAVCTALDRLPTAVAPADREAAERALVRHAREQDSQFVAAVGLQIGDCLNPDGTFTDEDRARRRGVVLGRQRVDGMSRISGWVDPECRAYLEAVTAAARPGRHLPAGASEIRDNRSAEQRCHDGLTMGLKAGIESGALGQHRGLPVTVIVTTTLGELEQAAGWARTGGTGRLPMRDVIRMASHAVHYLAVFEDHSARPLYLGRAKRLATADHRIICYARDRGCTKPGCFEPGYHSEVHHALPWSEGGATDATNVFFGCACDHTMATEGEYTTTVTEDGRIAWSDGTGPPRVNDAHHPERLLDDDDGSG